MINQRKVRTMARTKVYETGEGKAALKLKDYCEDMPLWKSLGSNALCGVLLFVLLATIVAAAFPQWAQGLLEQSGSASVVVITILSMLVFAALYSMAADTVQRYLYRKKRSSLCGYTADIQRLEKIKKEQDQ